MHAGAPAVKARAAKSPAQPPQQQTLQQQALQQQTLQQQTLQQQTLQQQPTASDKETPSNGLYPSPELLALSDKAGSLHRRSLSRVSSSSSSSNSGGSSSSSSSSRQYAAAAHVGQLLEGQSPAATAANSSKKVCVNIKLLQSQQAPVTAAPGAATAKGAE
ncbi:hypothetical protein, conserved [Eimeria tenella]|uniref:Uncharacterized protein n=1 Tax=Eimeria tenella TaxID=5802 RepID=U6KIJ8_EIMTE|nr:hypothetical protein, conserved [Eimeria tenella]CDJ37764.1 hypothetical protein, conserved [Eimeria tenella]|eukprot:XP_013228602.1 hypothetical protein, conserved [Eimeria tenella]